MMPALIAQYGLLIVALIIYTGEIGVPTLIPGEIALLIAGSQVIHSSLALVGAILFCGMVDILGTSSIHLASRSGGNKLLLRMLKKIQGDDRKQEEVMDRWRARLGGRDSLVVFVTRLIPMFRLYASITTGLIRIRFRDFIMGAVPASLLWAATPLTLGFLLRSQIAGLKGQYALMMHFVISGSVLLAVLSAGAWWVRRGGSAYGALRRGRILLSLTAVVAILVRLLSLALLGSHSISHDFLLPYLPAASAWVSIVTFTALGLLWIAHLDLEVIRGHHPPRRHHVGVPNVALWLGLMVLCGLGAAWNGMPYPGILSLVG
ncbi:MAG: DedA family protein [Chloroflexota bacterium]